MSRGGRDDAREAQDDRVCTRAGRDESADRGKGLPLRDVQLPKGEARESVRWRHREYELNGSETRHLATIGAFRVVAAEDRSSSLLDDVMLIEEVAAALKITPKQIRRLEHRGEFPIPRLPKLDRHPRYARALVERFVSGEVTSLLKRRYRRAG